MTPARQVRADFGDDTITVYQAFSAAIALPAAANNSFKGTPFKLDRMTWVKPSFLWMMYRSGWATKPGQEHVLAIQITRTGFEEALHAACLSHYDRDVYPDHASWEERKRASPVRVQWDPERNLALKPLPWRSLQVGLSGSAAHLYVHRWTVTIDDITPHVHVLREQVTAGRNETAQIELPEEQPYPLPASIARLINTDPISQQ